ncbi:hypothetical protein RHMOL_Rhmol03G0013100 [Rhododendron molle]|uniref:Uncharacterized protein n=1 Tax=Rhododendron molle TaxID=49168 RepID=A0ACC0PAI0_RHOML|nr:hypothetical protein RHMOL_Rhmol03G0013100 [Rhododendron molle]
MQNHIPKNHHISKNIPNSSYKNLHHPFHIPSGLHQARELHLSSSPKAGFSEIKNLTFALQINFTMDMKKIACAALISAAAMGGALAQVSAPAPGPVSDAAAALPVVGFVGASILSFVALVLN